MAPLEGVTDGTFRSCYYDHFRGLDSALTPFLPVPDRVKRVPLRTFSDVALPGVSKVKEIPQLLLSEESAFITAVKSLERAGYDEVNWNLGCPSRGVIRKGKGSGLLPDTSKILKILDSVMSVSSIGISIKMRLGLTSPEEGYALLPELRNIPLVSLTVHPRTGDQMYRGEVDLVGFERALELYGKPVCYNGDINTLEDFLALKKRFPSVDQWMLGRGVLADPFLPACIKDFLDGEGSNSPNPGGHPLRQREFRYFLDDLILRMESRFHREIALINYLKGILLYSFSSDSMAPSFRERLLRIKTVEEWNCLKSEIYDFLDS